MQSRPGRINTSKPVNINISFTINPKNVLNQAASQSAPRKAREKSEGRSVLKAATPDLPSTERPVEPQSELKTRRKMKRHSVDQCFMHQKQISSDLKQLGETVGVKKPAVRQKRKSELSGKRTHNKTASKMSAFENMGLRSVMLDNTTMELRREFKKSMKQNINKIINGELSKKSLPPSLPTQQVKSARKKKLKKTPAGQSEHLMKRGSDRYDRQELIEKLTSLRSMNNSLFPIETEQQPRGLRETIVVPTEQSMDCIEEIHEMEIRRRYEQLDQKKSNADDKLKANQTRHLIETYIAILNEEIDLEGEVEVEQEGGIREEFERFRRIHEEHRVHSNGPQNTDSDKEEDRPLQCHQIVADKGMTEVEPRRNHGFAPRDKIKVGDELRPFCSSEMTKEQKLINELERIKLQDLKKHEVEKWGQLLTFIKESIQSGKSDTEQILENVYKFLQRAKDDLQRELGKSSPKNKNKSDLQSFTQKLSQENKEQQEEIAEQGGQKEGFGLKDNQFEDISSMSYQDEAYEEQNEGFKLMNLEMIQNALKARHEGLVEKRQKELRALQEQKNSGKLSEKQWEKECARVDKWIKKETGEIAQARKSLWRGYNQAKGIIEKTLISRQFQEESGKKKGMMKCLSEDYLLKSNYKSLLRAKAAQKSQESEEEDEQQSERSEGGSSEAELRESALDADCQDEQASDQQHHELHHDKETIQLRELGKEQDMDVIKERLLDIKHKHLKDDEVELSSNENAFEVDDKEANVSYEEVDNQLQESYGDEEMKIINEQFSKGLGPQAKKEPEAEHDERLKHLLPEDKEDIFEFIFLDLSIQLYQESCSQNRIMDSINRHVENVKRQALKKKGVKTNLTVVKEYIKRFTGFIIRAHKDILKTLDSPVGPSAIEMLRYMHDCDEEPRDEEEAPTTLVIPTAIFDQFEKQLLPSIEFEVYYERDAEREAKRVQFLKNVLHIHNKAIFDALNEYLDLLRPFGLWGKPFPWKKTPAFLHEGSQEEREKKLQKASDKVGEYCSYVCGLLVDKEESLVGNARLSDEYIESIKEDRLSRMLATDLMDNEERWLFYDDEETEVLVDISTAIWFILVKEAGVELRDLWQ